MSRAAAPAVALPALMASATGATGRGCSGGPGAIGAPTRAAMNARFGHDFGDVRVHTGPRAAESARAVNAVAYTVGRDVVFGEDHYQPGTRAALRLLAHELAHVVQQRGVDPSVAPLGIGLPESPQEREADGAADAAAGGWALRLHAGVEPGPVVRRQWRAAAAAVSGGMGLEALGFRNWLGVR